MSHLVSAEAREGERLRQGSRIEAPAGVSVVEVAFTAAVAPQGVLDRVREVLLIVGGPSEGEWPTLNDWRALLPEWFVGRCAPESTEEEAARWLERWRRLDPSEQATIAEHKPWELGNWLYWFEPGNRHWYWIAGTVNGPHSGRVLVEATEWPFPWGSLRWLLTASGAKSVEQVHGSL